MRGNVIIISCFTALMLLWLICKPGTPEQFVAGDDLIDVFWLLAVFLFNGNSLLQRWRCTPSRSSASSRLLAPLLLLSGVLAFLIGDSIWAFYEVILHQATPFPSWPDVLYIGSYPLLGLGILLLPLHAQSGVARTRILLDGMMSVTALVTFSWFFILGPTIQQGANSWLSRIVGTAYPVCDIILICCLLLVMNRAGGQKMHTFVWLIAAGLLIIVVADSAFDYLTLQNAYSTGNFIDLSWPVSYSCIMWGAYAAFAQGERQTVQSDKDSATFALLPAMLPYLFIPAVALLAVITHALDSDPFLQTGVDIASAVLIVLVVLRQFFASRETLQYAHAMQRLNAELHEANAQLAALASTDPLTGLLNHRAMAAMLDDEIARAQRHQHACALIFLDLDHFKLLNDTHGHQMGDDVLREFAQVIRLALRDADVVGRWGGEEFVVMLPEIAAEQAKHTAERVCAVVAEHIFVEGAGLHITCSVGVAAFPTDASSQEQLVHMADQAMYLAKRFGRNQIHTASELNPDSQEQQETQPRAA
jgi:diguanylate cyclase (GGDEF)-like protein